jgi:uncharacterized protein (TIGR03067 family)
MTCRLLVALGMLLMLSFSLHADDPNKKGEGIDGTWLPTKAELGGQPFPKEVLESMKLVVEDGKYVVTVGTVIDKGTLKQDLEVTPRALDILGTEGPNKGKTFLTIYERSGDTLRVCYDLSGKTRPTEFKTKEGTQLFLVTYKKQTR